MIRSVRSLLPDLLFVLTRAGLTCCLAVSLAHGAITTCTVNTALDDPAAATATVNVSTNSGTLRDCILVANLLTSSTGTPTVPGLTITFAPGLSGATIALNNDLPLLFNNTVIDASALNSPVNIDGGNSHRIFFISGLPPIPVSGKPDPDSAQAIAVTLRSLSLQHGLAKGGDSSGDSGGGGGMGAGGALFINKGASVVLAGVSFVGNIAQGGTSSGGAGGFVGGGGGGMGAGTSDSAGGGLGSASAGGGAAGLGTGGTAGGSSGGWGGQGLGQLSGSQGFNPTYFEVDAGSGTGGLGLIGGGGSFSNRDGGFGGGGAFKGNNSAGGRGGFGGGGGGGWQASGEDSGGGNGGFGGGGGGAYQSAGGNGGFGGGGGYLSPLAGGSGGGGVVGGFAGGGAGFGGAIFVRAGGGLAVQNLGGGGSIAGGAVIVAPATATTRSGAAAGSGLFLMTSALTTFDIAGSYSISDTLADDSKSTLPVGQSYAAGNGAGAAMSKIGTGTLILSGVNTYAGTTAINDGIFRIASPGDIHASATTVAASGTLTGDGMTGSVNTFGTTAPGTQANPQGTLHIIGLLHVQPGALTCFHANGAGAISDINATGGATLSGIARIDFSGGPTVGTTYFPISASSISGTFAGYETNMANLLGHFTYGPTSVTFTIDASDVVFRNGMEQPISDSPCIAAFAN